MSLSRKIISLLEYILVFLIIISMRSVFIHVSNGQANDRLIKLVILLVVILLLSFNLKKIRFTKTFIFGFTVYYISSVVLFLYNSFIINDGLLAFIFNLLLLLPCFIVLCWVYYLNNSLIELFSKYTNIIIIISLIALCFWVFGSFLHIIQPNVNLLSTWADEQGRVINGYYYLYFETQKISLLGFEGWRNTAIFVEGPMYNILLLIAFAQILLIENKKVFIKSTIIFFSILSILSTTGIFLAFFMIFYKFYLHHKLTKKKLLLSLSLAPFLLYASFIFLYNLALDKSQSGSALMRWDDIYAGFMAWSSSPILGNGYTHLEAIFPYMNMSFRPNTGYSNGILSSLVQGGGILFMLYFAPFLVLLFSRNQSRDLKFSIVLWMILLFSTIVDNTPLFLFISGLAYAVSFRRNN